MSHEENKRLILRHRRHLQKLQEQKASFGLHTPAHILTEIEDVKAEIKKLERELGLLDSSQEPDSLDEKTRPVSWHRILVGGIIFAVVLFGAVFLAINWYTKDQPVGSTPDSVWTSTSTLSGCTPSDYSEFPTHSIAIIEPDIGAKSQVPFNTLKYRDRSELILASGMIIEFKQIKNFQLSNVDWDHFTADVVITLLNCEIHEDVIKSQSDYFLEGETEFGPLKLRILDVKRVDFE